MPAVRYVALAALVVWLGLTVAAIAGQPVTRFHEIAVGCGVTVLAAYFVMKFVGPPPRAFVVRAAIVFVMLAVATATWLARGSDHTLVAINGVLGFVLLYWYSTE